MGYNPCSKFPQITHLKYKTSHTNKMNPATIVSAVVAGTSSGLGTSVILASGAGIPTAAAVIGAGLLLKAGALLLINQSRSKRSAEDTDAIFTTIAAAEPASCVKQLICDIATGTKPSENDIILFLFESETPVTSPKFDFAVAATLGKQLKSVEACELRYTCPVKL